MRGIEREKKNERERGLKKRKGERTQEKDRVRELGPPITTPLTLSSLVGPHPIHKALQFLNQQGGS